MLTALSSKPATAVANGLAILTPIFAVISWLIPDWFGQLSVPKALLVGLGLALAFLFATAILLAIFAWAYRRFRPLPAAGNSTPLSATDDEPLERRLARLEHNHSNHTEHLTKAQKGLTVLAEHIGGVERRFDASLADLRASVGSEAEGLRAYLSGLQERVTELRGMVQAQQESFKAIYHREQMLALAQVIDASSLELGMPLANGKVVDQQEWDVWKRNVLAWEAKVGEWAALAGIYLAGDPMDDITRITREGLDQNWGAKAEQFPSSDPEALRIYKSFRIYLRSYASIRDVVHEKVRRKAFEGVQV